MTVIAAIRAFLFYLLSAIILLPCACIFCPLAMLTPFSIRYQIVTLWNRGVLAILKLTCGIDHHVEGLENLPEQALVVVAKHNCTWEAVYLQLLFTPSCTILKRELLWIPFFGWGLSMLKPVAIKRSNPKEAIKQLQTQGRQRLKDGISVLIFPEGTRVDYGSEGTYARGGASLAKKAGVQLVPLAHNAGKYWPNKGWLKTPGTIQVRIGPPLNTQDKTAAQLTEEARDWIESTIPKLP
jgi:1-acyl-sn-glycerol-3-phosphate acyltransferase